MKLKTFQAKTMAEALDQVKRRLGRDAVILHTRSFTRGGFLGFGGCPMVEITAARSVADLPVQARLPRVTARSRPPQREAENAAAAPAAASAAPTAVADPAITAELTAVKSMVQELVRESRRLHRPSLPEELSDCYLRLAQGRVSEELAEELISSVRQDVGEAGLQDAEAVQRRLASYIEGMIPISGPTERTATEGPTVIALVGPTGVGKTTTIAKLAANFRLRENLSVGLITVDTYRIAAVEQLRTYAQIIDVPLEVVMTPAQLGGALERLKDCDMVLIDTAGRSQNDPIRMNELRAYLDRAKPHETHLVLSSTSSQEVIDQVLSRFGDLGIDRVIFTKLDEAIGFGVILTSLRKVHARLSYITTGQDVPDDIEVGRASRVADLILCGESLHEAAGSGPRLRGIQSEA